MAALLLAAILAAGLLTSVPAVQVAPGCSTGRPTWFGGTIRGYPDNRALNVHLGVSFHSSTRKVNPDGSPDTDGAYGWIFVLNPDHPPTGLDTGERVWGICVHRSIVRANLEAYPKRPLAPGDLAPVTDKSRYGSAAHYRQPITPGRSHNVLLRLPLTWQAGRGNTGGVHGYVWYGNRRVPPENITRVRAFPYTSGPACGVEGYSAAADQLAAGTAGTYYRMDYLAGGQCGRAYQEYSFQMDCTGFCGEDKRSFAKRIRITRGQRPRVDVRF